MRARIHQLNWRLDVRGHTGWAIEDQAQRLNRLAGRVSRGQVPPNGYLNVAHVVTCAQAIGLNVSDFMRIVEARGTRGVPVSALATCPSWCDNHLTTEEGEEVCARIRRGTSMDGERFVKACERVDGQPGIDMWTRGGAVVDATAARVIASALVDLADALDGR